jgi:hypothetical protein
MAGPAKRPTWGPAVGGAAGAFDVLAMALSGRPTIASIDRSVVR